MQRFFILASLPVFVFGGCAESHRNDEQPLQLDASVDMTPPVLDATVDAPVIDEDGGYCAPVRWSGGPVLGARDGSWSATLEALDGSVLTFAVDDDDPTRILAWEQAPPDELEVGDVATIEQQGHWMRVRFERTGWTLATYSQRNFTPDERSTTIDDVRLELAQDCTSPPSGQCSPAVALAIEVTRGGEPPTLVRRGGTTPSGCDEGEVRLLNAAQFPSCAWAGADGVTLSVEADFSWHMAYSCRRATF